MRFCIRFCGISFTSLVMSSITCDMGDVDGFFDEALQNSRMRHRLNLLLA